MISNVQNDSFLLAMTWWLGLRLLAAREIDRTISLAARDHNQRKAHGKGLARTPLAWSVSAASVSSLLY